MDFIDIGIVFSQRLVNRDARQGDGKYTAEDFRKKYLSFLDSAAKWANTDPEIALDFTHVDKIGPSFANEVFAYFAKYAKKEQILRKIRLINISKVKLSIIEEEIESGYSR